MVSTVAGSGLGLFNTQALGADGGRNAVNPTGGSVWVNAASGNLVLRDVDEFLVGRGLDAQIVRTYNSRGLYDDDNGDNFRFSFSQQLKNLVAGVSVVRVNGDGSETTFTYDSASGLYRSTDGDGAHDTLHDDGSGVWTYREGSSGLIETYAWISGSGCLTSQLDSEGLGITTIAYDSHGRVIQLTDSSGQQLDVLRDAVTGDVSSLRTSSNGVVQSVVSYTYETYATDKTRLHTVTLDLTPDNTTDNQIYTTTYSYLNSTSNLIGSIVHSDGTTVSFEYDGADNSSRVTKVTAGSGADAQVTEYVYSTGSTDIKQRLAAGVYATTTVNYDSAGRITSVVTPPDTNGQRLTTSYVHDAAGNVIKTTDARNASTYFSYDVRGNLILQQDDLGHTTEWAYDNANRLQNVIAFTGRDATPGDSIAHSGIGNGVNDASSALVTRYVYDGAGRLRFVVGNDGGVREARYSDSGTGTAATRTVTQIVYGASHRFELSALTKNDTLLESDLTDWLAGISDKSDAQVSETQLDFRGQVTQVRTFAKTTGAGAGDASDPGTISTIYSLYDQHGRLLRSVDARGSGIDDTAQDTVYAYDGLGRLISVSSSDTATTNQAVTTLYDDANQRTVTQQANGLLVTATYNRAGAVVSTQEFDANSTPLSTTRYVYDNAGLLRAVQDPVGGTQYYFYDQLGRTVGVIDGAGALTEYSYDGAGNVVGLKAYAGYVDAAAIAALAAQAASGHFSATTTDDALDGMRPDVSRDRVLRNVYNAAGQLWYTLDPSGAVTEFVYDGAGRLTGEIGHAVTGLASDAPIMSAQDRVTHYFYDATGNLRGALDAAGHYTGYHYDAAGHLVESIRSATVVALGDAQADVIPTSAADVYAYSVYDAQGRLLASIDGEGYVTTWTYDANGSAISMTRYANSITRADSVDGSKLATALTAVNGDASRLNLSAILPSSNSAHDAVVHYTYNTLNQLASATDASGVTTVYAYNSEGQLQAAGIVPVGGGTTLPQVQWLYDEQGRVSEVRGARYFDNTDAAYQQQNNTHSYDAVGRKLSSTDARGNTTTYVYDAAGRLHFEVNSAREVLKYAYNAFGEQTAVQRFALPLAAEVALTDAAIANALAQQTSASTDMRAFYDQRGQLQFSVDALGYVTRFQYDVYGNITTILRYQTALPDFAGLTDADGAVVLAFAGVQDAIAGATLSEQRAYNADNQVRFSIDAQGVVTETRYDALGNATQVIEHAVAPPAWVARDEQSFVDFYNGVLTDNLADQFQTLHDQLAQKLAQLASASTVLDRSSWLSDPYNASPFYDAGDWTEIKARLRAGLQDRAQAMAATLSAAEWALLDTLLQFGEGAGLTLNVGAQEPGITELAFPAGVLIDPNNAVTAQLNLTPRAGESLAAYIQRCFTAAGEQLISALGAQAGDSDSLSMALALQLEHPENFATPLSFFDAQALMSSESLEAQQAVSQMLFLALIGIDVANMQVHYDADLQQMVFVAVAMEGVPEINAFSAGLTLTNYAAATEAAVAHLAAVVQADAQRTLRHAFYDHRGRMTSEVDAQGYITAYGYDANNHVTGVTNYDLSLWNSATSLAGKQNLSAQQVADFVAAQDLITGSHSTTSLVYNSAGQRIYQVDPLGYVTGYAYDNQGRIDTRIVYSTALTNVAAFLAAPAEPSGVSSKSYLYYDAADNLRYQVDAEGGVAVYDYDANGNVIRATTFSDSLWSWHDPVLGSAGGATRPSREFLANFIAGSTGASAVKQFIFDSKNQLSASIDAMGIVTTYRYDSRGYVLSQRVYKQPLVGALVDFLAGHDGSNDSVAENYLYDPAGELIYSVDGSGYITAYSYDANGQRIATTRYDNTLSASLENFRADPGVVLQDARYQAKVATYLYYERGQLRFTLDQDGAFTHYEYDARGNLMRLSKSQWHAPTGEAIAVVLSERPDLATLVAYTASYGFTDVELAVERYAYDARGQLHYVIEDSGYVTEYRYDASGALAEKIRHAMPVPAWLRADETLVGDYLSCTASPGLVAEVARHYREVVARLPAPVAPEWNGSIFADMPLVPDATSWSALEIQIQTRAAQQAQALIAQLRAVFGADYDFIEQIVASSLGRGLNVSARADEWEERLLSNTTFATDIAGNVLASRTDANGYSYYVTIDALGNETPYSGETRAAYADTLVTNADPVALSPVETLDFHAGESLAQSITRLYADAAQSLITALRNKTDASEIYTLKLSGLNVQNFADLKNDPNVLAALAAIGFSGSLANVTLTASANPMATLMGGGATDVTLTAARSALDGVPELKDFSFDFNIVSDIDTLPAIPASGSQSQAALQYLFSVTGPAGATTRQHAYYDARGQLLYAVDAEGFITAYAYDASGNTVATKIYDSALDVALLAANPSLQTIRAFVQAHGAGAQQFFHYDSLGRLTYKMDALGYVTGFDYDARGNVVTTRVYPNPSGVDLDTFAAAPTGTSANTYAYYDDNDRLIYQVDALGYISTTRYDARGNVLSVGVYRSTLWQSLAAAGTPVDVTMRPAQDVIVSFAAANAADKTLQTFTYDNNNRRTSHSDADGLVTTFTYDAHGNVLSTTTTRPLANVSHTQLDSTFGAGGLQMPDLGADFSTADMVQQSGGKLVVAGRLGSDLALLRYNVDGSPDTSFGVLGIARIHLANNETPLKIIQQADGKLVLLASVRPDGGEERAVLVRYDANGGLDQDFGSGGVVSLAMAGAAIGPAALLQQADGKLVLVASKGIDNDDGAHWVVARYLGDGNLDETFNGDGIVTKDFVRSAIPVAVLQRPDGTLLVFGAGINSAWDGYEAVQCVLDAGGDTDTGFGGGDNVISSLGGFSMPYAAAQQADGKIVTAGMLYQEINGEYTQVISVRRYNLDGSIDTSFGGGAVNSLIDEPGSATAVQVQADGKILVTGSTVIDGRSAIVLMRYNADGSRDSSFGDNGRYYTATATGAVGNAVVRQADDKVVVAASSGDGKHLLLARYVPIAAGASTAEAASNTENFFYDNSGRLLGKVDAEGYITCYDYDPLGQRIATTRYRDPLAVSIGTLRAAPAQVLASTNVIASKTYEYYRHGQHYLSVDADGYVTRYTQDNRGNVILSERLDVSLWSDTALAANKNTRPDQRQVEAFLARREQDPQNTIGTRHYVYDERNALRFDIDATGIVTELRYDAAGNVVQRIDHALCLPQSVVYSESALAAYFAAQGVEAVETFAYLDTRGEVLYTLDASGTVVANRYDANGNLIRRAIYKNAFWASATHTSTRPTQAAIEAFISAQDQAALVSGISAASVRQYVYDALGQNIYQIDATGDVTGYAYNALGQLEHVYRFASVLPAGTSVDRATLDNLYRDARGAADTVVSDFYYDGGRLSRSVDGAGEVTEYVYDEFGHVAREDRFLNSTTARTVSALQAFIAQQRAASAVAQRHWVYDGRGLKRFAVDEQGIVTRFEHDAAGAVIATSQYSGAYTPAANASDAYSEAALAAFTDAQSAVTSRIFYDAGGDARLSVDRDGYATLNSFDRDGNVRAVYRALAPLAANALDGGYTAVAYAMLSGAIATVARHTIYDARGLPIYQQDNSGSFTANTYDAQGRLLRSATYAATTPLHTLAQLLADANLSISGMPSADQLRTIEDLIERDFRASLDTSVVARKSLRIYDDANHRQYDIDALGYVTETGLNALGEVAYTLRYAHVVIADSAASALVIDSYIHSAERNDPANQKTVYHYDDDGQLRYRVAPDSSVVEYRYDGLGNVVTELHYRERVANPDSADFSGLNGNNAQVIRYVYDGVGRLRYSVDASRHIAEIRYDGLGRLIASIDWTVDPGAVAALTAFNEHSIATLLALGASGAQTRYEYDLRGNTSAVMQGETLIAGSAGEQVDASARSTEHVLYDAFNRQQYRVDALGIVTEFRYDGLGNVITQIRYAQPLGNDLAAFLSDPQAALSASHDTHWGSIYRYYDGRGQLTLSVDATGHVTRHGFDADGNLIDTTQYATSLWSSAAGAGLDVRVRPGVEVLNAFIAQQEAGADSGTTQRWVYDAFGQLQFAIDGARQVTAYVRDLAGNVIDEIHYAAVLPTWVGAQAADIQDYYDGRATASLAQKLTDFLSGALSSLSAAYGTALTGFADVGAAGLAQNSWSGIRAQAQAAAVQKAQAFLDGMKQRCGGDYAIVVAYLQQIGFQNIGLSAAGDERPFEHTEIIIPNPTQVILDVVDGATHAQTNGELHADAGLSFEQSIIDLYTRAASQVIDAFAATQNLAETYTLTLNNAYGPIPETSAGVVDASKLESQATISDLLQRWPQLRGHITDATVTAYSDLWNHLQLQGSLGADGAPDLASLQFDLQLPDANAISASSVQSLLTHAPLTRTHQYAYYDHFGQLLYTVDAGGYVRATDYDAAGNIIGSRVSAGSLWDVATRPGSASPAPDVAVIDAFMGAASATFNQRAISVYNTLQELVYQIDGNGFVSAFSYDGCGNVVRETRTEQALAQGAALDADSLGAWLDAQGAAGHVAVTDNLYGDDNRLRFTVDRAGYLTEYAYDALGNVIAESRFANAVGARDVAALETFATDQRLYHAVDVTTTRAAFAANSQQLFAIDARGQVSEYRYDVNGNVCAELRYAAAYVPSGSDPYSVAALAAFYADPAHAAHSLTSIFSDADGRPLLVVDADGYVTVSLYDRNGVQVAVNRSREPLSAAQRAQDGNAIVRDLLAGTIASSVAFSLYDGAGQPLYNVDAAGYLTVNRYDTSGRVIQSQRYREPIALHSLAQVLGMTPPATASALELQQWQNLLQTDRLATIQDFLIGAQRNNYTVEQRVNDDAEHHRSYTADPLGQIMEQGTDGAGQVTYRTVYDGALLAPAQLADPDLDIGAFVRAGNYSGRTTHYYYDADGRLQYTVSAEGAVEELRYDGANHLIGSIDYQLPLSSLVSAPGSADFTQVLAGAAKTTRLFYSSDERLLLHIDGDGFATAYAYDDEGNLLASNKTTAALTPAQLALDNNVLVRNMLAGDIATAGTYTFNDAAGRALYTIDDGGHLTVNRYGGSGQIAQTRVYTNAISFESLAQVLGATPDAAPASSTLPRWQQLLRDNRLAAIETFISAQANNYRATQVVYDAASNRHFSIDADGKVTEVAYNSLGAMTRSVAYEGALVSAANLADDNFHIAQYLDSGAFVNRLDIYHYDDQGELTLIESADRMGGTTLSVKYYDGAGRLRYAVDTSHHVREIRYDAAGNASEAIDYRERLTTVDTLDLTGLTAKIVYRYDSAGHLRYTVNALGFVEEQQYDAAGNVSARIQYAQALASIDSTDFETLTLSGARVTRSVYDSDNRLRYTVDAENHVTENRYDANGKVSQTIQWFNNPALMPNTLALDAATIDAAVAGSVSHATTYTYPSDRHKIITDALGQVETDIYDEAGRLTHQFMKDGGEWTYIYNAAGRLSDKTSPEVAVTIPGATPATSTQRIVTHYEYDAAGNVISETEAYGSEYASTKTFTYDAYNRLLTATQPSSKTLIRFDAGNTPATGALIPVYGAATAYRQQWYDALGNVVVSRDIDGHYTYRIYDAADQLRFEVNADRYVTGYTYDADGNVATLTMYANAIDLGGHAPEQALTLAEMASRMAQTPDSARDRVMTYRYDALGRQVESEQNAVFTVDTASQNGAQPSVNGHTAASITQTAYNAFGEVSATTQTESGANAPTQIVSFEYNQRGERSALVDANLYRTAWTYDAAGNVTTITEYATASDSRDSVPATSAQDRVILKTYDAVNLLIREDRLDVPYYSTITHAMTTGTRSTLYEYNGAGQVTKITPSDGSFSTFIYDSLGRLTQVTEPERALGGGAAATPWTDYQYDYFGNVVSETRHAGQSGSDAPADQVVQRRFDAQGNTIWEQDPLGHITEHSYDNSGHLLRSWYHLAIAGQGETIAETRYQYDARGHQSGVTLATVGLEWRDGILLLGVPGRYVVDVSSEATHWQRYNAFGEIEAKGVGADELEVFAYDQAGRLVRSNTGDGVVRLHGYDAFGRETLMAQDASAANFASVNSLQQLFTTGTWQNTEYALQVFTGNSAISTGLHSGSTAPTIRQTDYDRWGNVVRRAGALGESVDYLYDADNHLIATTLNGVDYRRNSDDQAVTGGTIVTRAYYDLLGHELGESDGNGHGALNSYNAAGQLLSVTNADGVVATTYTYDGFGRQLTQTAQLSALSPVSPAQTLHATTQSHRYDANGNRVESVQADGTHVFYTYDWRGLKLSESNANGTTTYAYDRNGNLIRSVIPEGVQTDYTYDVYGNRLSEVLTFFTPSQVAWVDQTWSYSASNGADGSATYSAAYAGYFHRLSHAVDASDVGTTYRYGAGNRLLRETLSTGASKTYAYDHAGQLLTITAFDGGSASLTTYGYDASGNRTREQYTAGATLADGVVSGGVVYQDSSLTYDRANRLIEVNDIGSTERPALHLAYQYDGAGNRVAVKDVIANKTAWYTYDAANRVTLAQATRNSDGTYALDQSNQNSAEYAYNNQGQRYAANYYSEGDKRWVTEYYDYDSAGRLVTVRRWRQYDGAVVYSQQTYDSQGRVASVTRYSPDRVDNAVSSTTTYEYSSAHAGSNFTYNDVATTVYNLNLSDATDKLYSTVVTDTKDVFGRLLHSETEQTTRRAMPYGNPYFFYAQTVATTYTYRDDVSQQVATTVASMSDSRYGALDNDTVDYSYDTFGNLVRVHRSSQPDANSDTRYVNDSYGQMIRRNSLGGQENLYFANNQQVADRSSQYAQNTQTIVFNTSESGGNRTMVSADQQHAAGEPGFYDRDHPLRLIYPAPATNIYYSSAQVTSTEGPRPANTTGFNSASQQHWVGEVHAEALNQAREMVAYLKSLSEEARAAIIAKLVNTGLDAIQLWIGIGSLEVVSSGTLSQDVTVNHVTAHAGDYYETWGQKGEVSGGALSSTVQNLKMVGDSDADLFNFFMNTVVAALDNGVAQLFQAHIGDAGVGIKPFVQSFQLKIALTYSVSASGSLQTNPLPDGAGGTLGSFTIRAGDTLQSLALAVYGNAGLWYLIADLNNLSGSEALVPGQILSLPDADSYANNVGTFKPYSPSDMLGDIGPQLNTAVPRTAPHYKFQPVNRGAEILQIFITIAAVLVALVASIVTFGAGMVLLAPLGALASGIIAGAVSGAVGSAASQGIMIATGMQEEFNWAQFGVDAFVGGLTFGIAGIASRAAATAARTATQLGQIVRALNSAAAARPVLGTAGSVAGNAGLGLAGGLLSEGILAQIEPGRQIDWVNVAAMSVGLGGGLALAGRMPKHLGTGNRSESDTVYFLGPDQLRVQIAPGAKLAHPTAAKSGRTFVVALERDPVVEFNVQRYAAKLGRQRTIISLDDASTMLRDGRIGENDKLTLAFHGNRAKKFGDYTLQYVVGKLGSPNGPPVKLGTLKLLVCGRDSTTHEDVLAGIGTRLGRMLEQRNVAVSRITRSTERVGVLPNGRAVAMVANRDGSDMLISKASVYKLESRKNEAGQWVEEGARVVQDARYTPLGVIWRTMQWRDQQRLIDFNTLRPEQIKYWFDGRHSVRDNIRPDGYDFAMNTGALPVWTFRGSRLDPQQVFQQGFATRPGAGRDAVTEQDLQQHQLSGQTGRSVPGSTPRTESRDRFVATSESPFMASQFATGGGAHEGWIYVVAPPQGRSYVMNGQSFHSTSPQHYEVAVDGGLKPGDILGAMRVDRWGTAKGLFQYNSQWGGAPLPQMPSPKLRVAALGPEPKSFYFDKVSFHFPDGVKVVVHDNTAAPVSGSVNDAAAAAPSPAPKPTMKPEPLSPVPNFDLFDVRAMRDFFSNPLNLYHKDKKHILPPSSVAYIDDGKPRTWLFRGAMTPTAEIFENGLVPDYIDPRNPRPPITRAELDDHQTSSVDSRLVSTTESIYVGARFATTDYTANGYIYVLRPDPQRAHSQNALYTPGPDPKPYTYYEYEYSLDGGVFSHEVYGAVPIDKGGTTFGHFIPNPNWNRPKSKL